MKTDNAKKEEDREYDLTAIGDGGALDQMIEEPMQNSEESLQSETEQDQTETEQDEQELSDRTDLSDESDESEESDQADRYPSALKLVRLAADILAGDCSEEELERLLDAATAREEIEAAYQRGLIEGKNIQIEEQLVMPAVGAPDLCGAPPVRARSGNSIFDLAREAK
ncbi:MAG: hypothetical protein K2M41_00520 [Muribaculaceae bacterium]|nr:hypothetical protein [Muribaculaceae bacterium]